MSDKKTFFSAPDVNKELLREFAALKKEFDVVANQQKEREIRMKEIREELLTQIPGNSMDKVEANVDNIIIKKFSRDKSGGKLKGKPAIDFARDNRLLNRVAVKEWVLDQKAFDAAVQELIVNGKLTLENYNDLIDSCYPKGDRWTEVFTVEDNRPEIVEIIDADERNIM